MIISIDTEETFGKMQQPQLTRKTGDLLQFDKTSTNNLQKTLYLMVRN